MGGSGGGGGGGPFEYRTPEQLAKLVRDAEQRTAIPAFEVRCLACSADCSVNTTPVALADSVGSERHRLFNAAEEHRKSTR